MRIIGIISRDIGIYGSSTSELQQKLNWRGKFRSKLHFFLFPIPTFLSDDLST